MSTSETKKDKSAVNYSVGGKDDCGDCEHYEPISKGLGSCTEVEGQIRPWMWCKLFKQKKKADG